MNFSRLRSKVKSIKEDDSLLNDISMKAEEDNNQDISSNESVLNPYEIPSSNIPQMNFEEQKNQCMEQEPKNIQFSLDFNQSFAAINQNMEQEPNQQVANLINKNVENEEERLQEEVNRNNKMTHQMLNLLTDLTQNIQKKHKKIYYYQQCIQQILEYSPKPRDKVENNSDSQNWLQYIQNINKLKDLCHFLSNIPIEYNYLQNKIRSVKYDFLQSYVQVCNSIQGLLNVTYKITKDDLGKQNDSIEKSDKILQECIQDLQKFQQNLKKFESVNSKISEHFSSFFGQELKNYDQEKQALLGELKKCEDAIQKKQEEVSIECCKTMMLISEKEINKIFHEQLIVQYEKRIKDLEFKIHKPQLELNNKNNEIIVDYDDRLQQLKEEKKKIMMEKNDKQIEKIEKINNMFNQYTKKVNSLNEKIPLVGKMQQLTQKQCFHYFFIQDESGSFCSDHQYAVDGATTIFEKIRENDYITYIKFTETSTVNIPKTLKKNLTTQDFQNKISNCKSGGTSFLSAFQTLLTQIENNYAQSEYPVVIFITDGQDNSQLDTIISQILSICQDLILYTIGYGSVNEDYLRNITNLFNNTQNEKREINGKLLNLFYSKNTPHDLTQSLNNISQQQGEISIEDIKNKVKFMQETYDSMSQQVDNHYNKIDNDYDKRIAIIDQTIKNLMFGDNISQDRMNQLLNQEISQNQTLLDEEKRKVVQEKKNVAQINDEIKILKNQFQQIFPYNNQTIEDFNLVEVQREKNKTIQNMFNSDKEAYQNRIVEINRKIEQIQKQQSQRILEFGFQCQEQFNTFKKYLNSTQEAQCFYYDLIQDLISLIMHFKYQNNSFYAAIETSQKFLEHSRKLDNQYYVFKQFQQIDNTIDTDQAFYAKKKILSIMNNSIYEQCKGSQQMEEFYDIVVRKIDFNDIIQNQIDNDKDENQKFIQTIIPQHIKKPKQLTEYQPQINKKNISIKKLQKHIEELKQRIQQEDDKELKKESKKQLEQVKLELENDQDELSNLKQDLELLQEDFNLQHADQIAIIEQIVIALIQSVQLAFFKKKYQMSKNQFCQLLNVANIFLEITNNQSLLAIQC
ncbi:hypothetical protein ABPG72_018615 [Tetrahymena utriculariae]